MKNLIARHRAALGIAAFVAALVFYTLPDVGGDPRVDAALIGLQLLAGAIVAAGAWALLSSPYWAILYRESPLRRARTGASDLDERELALRDRASGLTYYFFVTLNMVLIAAAAVAVGRGWIALDGETLMTAVIPYSWLGLVLPVLMLEYFEPSGDRPAPLEEEEA